MKIKLLFTLILIVSLFKYSFATIRYAKENGVGNGNSWEDASADIQLLINNSDYGDTIYVTEGTYYPIRPVDNINIIDEHNKNNSFLIKNGVRIIGGFPNNTPPDLTERNTEMFPAVFSGDIGVLGDQDTNNCYHVIVALNCDSNTILDGLTVTGGSGFTTVATNVILNGTLIGPNLGGGMAIFNSNLRCSNIKFIDNHKTTGGGAFCKTSNITINKSSFVDNSAGGGGGGGIENTETSIVHFKDVTFENNTSQSNGGAIRNTYSSYSDFEKCIFKNNTASVVGGAMSTETNFHISKIINCSFTGNYAENSGGAIYNNLAECNIVNGLFVNNTVSEGYGGAIYCGTNSSTAYATNCTFYGNSAFRGGAIAAFITIPEIINSIFDSNTITDTWYENTEDFYMGSLATNPPNVTYSLIQPADINLLNATGNITGNPAFVDPANGDFRITCESDVINSGTNSAFDTGATIDNSSIYEDLLNNPRIVDGIVDMGAFEYSAVDTIYVSVCEGGSYIYKGEVYYPPFIGIVDSSNISQECDSFTALNLSEINIDNSVSIHNDSLIANNNLATSFQWINCKNNDAIPNATNFYLIPNDDALYKVLITQDGCNKESECYSLSMNSINNITGKESFNVYPNPVSNKITINRSDRQNLKAVQIIDIVGQTVLCPTITKNANNNFIIDVSTLIPGQYYIKAIWKDDITLVRKIIKID